MANAVKKISVARGYDVTRYTLQCFGGAGGQHACLVADALGIDTVFVHPLAGVLSAYGMGLADQMRDAAQAAVERRLDGALAVVGERLAQLADDASAELAAPGRRRADAVASCTARAPALRGHRHPRSRFRSAPRTRFSPRSRPRTGSGSRS